MSILYILKWNNTPNIPCQVPTHPNKKDSIPTNGLSLTEVLNQFSISNYQLGF